MFTSIITEDLRGRDTVPRYIEYAPPGFELTEMLRYSGYPADRAVAVAKGELREEELLGTVDEIRRMCEKELAFKIGYTVRELSFDAEGYPILPFEQHSDNLKGNLEGCVKVILFAATIGSGIDRFIRRYERTKQQTALFLQGFGAERVESLTNAFNRDVNQAAKLIGYRAHPRYSPGFGDLPLTVQTEFLQLLDAGRRMGITLNESLLMSPSKSVTAVIGLEIC